MNDPQDEKLSSDKLMTYRELRFILDNMSEKDLDTTTTIYVSGEDEWYGIMAAPRASKVQETDVLDKGQKYFVV